MVSELCATTRKSENGLIEERARTNLQAHARRLTDTMRRLDRHFNPAAESG
nr:hypothetical protein [uncultured Alistipes sp.]